MRSPSVQDRSRAASVRTLGPGTTQPREIQQSLAEFRE